MGAGGAGDGRRAVNGRSNVGVGGKVDSGLVELGLARLAESGVGAGVEGWVGAAGEAAAEGGAWSAGGRPVLSRQPPSPPPLPARSGERRLESSLWFAVVCGGLSSAVGVVQCGRSAGCVLCVLWVMSAAVCVGGYPVGVSISSSSGDPLSEPVPSATANPTAPRSRLGAGGEDASVDASPKFGDASLPDAGVRLEGVA